MPLAFSSLSKSPVVDTNILFDFLVWRFHKETQTALHQSLLHHLSGKPLPELSWYLDLAKPVQTSFHVIAEIYGLTKKKPDWTVATRGLFWKFAREELSVMELGEHPVKIAEMHPEDLALLGPSDTSILILAIRLKAVVLTEDGNLRDRCAKREIEVLNYGKVLELWTKHHVT